MQIPRFGQKHVIQGYREMLNAKYQIILFNQDEKRYFSKIIFASVKAFGLDKMRKFRIFSHTDI